MQRDKRVGGLGGGGGGVGVGHEHREREMLEADGGLFNLMEKIGWPTKGIRKGVERICIKQDGKAKPIETGTVEDWSLVKALSEGVSRTEATKWEGCFKIKAAAVSQTSLQATPSTPLPFSVQFVRNNNIRRCRIARFTCLD